MNNAPQILLHPLRPALIAGASQVLPVLVRVQAPDQPEAEAKPRRPYHIAFVIDRSGSMSGRPLQEAVRCVSQVLTRLQPTDKASLVVFDDEVQVLLGLSPLGDGSAISLALSTVTSGGTTNLYGGWLAGAETLQIHAHEAAVSRVILLSDGNANAGELTGPADISAACARAAAMGTSTSTYGLGKSFNEELMVGMGQQGAGNHYYGASAADLLEPFSEEFDLLSNLFARHLQLSLCAAPGVALDVLNKYPAELRAGFPTVRLPDLAFGSEAWALVQLSIPKQSLPGQAQLLQASLAATSPSGLPVRFNDALLSLPEVSAAHWEALLPDPLVVTRLKEIELAQLLDQARLAAANGNWAEIKRLVDQAHIAFAGQPWLQSVLEELSALAAQQDTEGLMKEAMYSSRRMSTRLSSKNEMLSLSSESDAPSFLRRKKAQGKSEFPPSSRPPRS